MKYYVVVIALVAVLLYSCEQSSKKMIDKNAIYHIIDSLMSEQQASWNEGNIDAFMKHYRNSDSLLFVGKRGIQPGWQQTLDNYRKSYPDKAAMGRLQFTNLHRDAIDQNNAYIIGKWELFRTADTLSGHYSLLWKRINNQWVIVADHSS